MLKLNEQSTQGKLVMRIRFAALLATLSIVCLPMQSFAAKGGEKGPSDQAYERASDNASFKREGGKPGKEEYRHDNDRDHDHDHDDGDSDSKWPRQKKGGNDEDDDSDVRKSRKKDDNDDKDESDSDHDVKSRDKKDKRKNK